MMRLGLGPEEALRVHAESADLMVSYLAPSLIARWVSIFPHGDRRPHRYAERVIGPGGRAVAWPLRVFTPAQLLSLLETYRGRSVHATQAFYDFRRAPVFCSLELFHRYVAGLDLVADVDAEKEGPEGLGDCLLYTSPSPRDRG